MNIKGEKVILRAIEPKDNPVLLEMINDDATEFMLGGWSFPISQKNQEEWTNSLKSDQNTLRCTIEHEGNPVGVVMLTNIDYKNGNAEVHIKLAIGNVRGKGYGTDSIMTIVRYAFEELRLRCVYAHVSDHNITSQKLFIKCGFKKEGIQRSRLFKKGRYIDVISFSIINQKE